jgi:hypothetical protein
VRGPVLDEEDAVHLARLERATPGLGGMPGDRRPAGRGGRLPRRAPTGRLAGLLNRQGIAIIVIFLRGARGSLGPVHGAKAPSRNPSSDGPTMRSESSECAPRRRLGAGARESARRPAWPEPACAGRRRAGRQRQDSEKAGTQTGTQSAIKIHPNGSRPITTSRGTRNDESPRRGQRGYSPPLRGTKLRGQKRQESGGGGSNGIRPVFQRPEVGGMPGRVRPACRR